MLVENLKTDFPNANIKVDAPLSNYSYTQTGGESDILIFPKEKKELVEIIRWISNENVSLTILGNASNLIVKDGGIRGITIILTDMDDISVEGNSITAQSGARIIDVSQRALKETLTGLEFACGIPGSTGGAVYMNAGAYGGEVKDCIENVTVLTRDGEVKFLTNEEMDFSYRHSYLQEENDIVIDVTFTLEKGEYEAIKDKMDDLTYRRSSKQPLEFPSCGSVFKRPEGHFTGKLIQDAELQGLIWGGAQISTKHAGFIVNINNATATNYIELICHIQQVIYDKFNVELETEVRIIGEDPERVSAKN